MKKYLGIDIGENHFSVGVAKRNGKGLTLMEVIDTPVEGNPSVDSFLELLSGTIGHLLDKQVAVSPAGIAVSVPGTFQYDKGFSQLSGEGLFSRLFGLNIQKTLINRLKNRKALAHIPIMVVNNGKAFLQGVSSDHNREPENLRRVSPAPAVSRCMIRGALIHLVNREAPGKKPPIRKSVNPLMAVKKGQKNHNAYDIYPTFEIRDGSIQSGFEGIAKFIAEHDRIVIDGYSGVDWEALIRGINEELMNQGATANWYCIDAAWKTGEQIDEMLTPFLGDGDPVFGRVYPGELKGFFDKGKLDHIQSQPKSRPPCISIIYGSGAWLADQEAPLIYIDVPKNEIQYRSRAGRISNMGTLEPRPPKKQYKRFYFIDWPALNSHKKRLLSRIDIIADGQQIDEITWMKGTDFTEALHAVTQNAFRTRPWFEPGVWGGQWMKAHIEGLNKDAVNYAWSFECIVPENGVVFQSDSTLLEVSFDFLMYYDNRAVLGEFARIFGDEFPIRFDFLDTVEGENLSLQCHPVDTYIKKHFSENFTQDETYYLLDATEEGEVYLGFRENIDAARFRQVLEQSRQDGSPVPVEDYVQRYSAAKHDFFLIPAGTVHCSGKGNLVLEISSTPYIYTFKMYDWLRLDLDGKPRPLNIERAFENLNFDRKGMAVEQELISSPMVIRQGENWRLVHLPTHPEHFYDVHRMEFDGEMEISMNNRFHLLNLVEGTSIAVKTNGRTRTIHYAETFIVPAAAGRYTLVNKGYGRAKVIKAFVKDDAASILR